MNFVKHNIQVLRRDLTKLLAKTVGKTSTGNQKPFLYGTDTIQNILVVRPNHRLGNLLLITPLIQEIENTFPNCKIDLLVKGGAAHVIFKNYKSVGRIISLPGKPFKDLIGYGSAWLSVKKYRYDLVINAASGSSSGRLLTQFANASYKWFGESTVVETRPDAEHFAKYAVYGLRSFLHTLGFPKKQTVVSPLDLRLNEAELSAGKQNVLALSENNPKVIGIFTYATGKKCYPDTWWIPVYERLKKDYPTYAIIEILPIENVSQINFSAKTFFSRDVREIGAVVANTAIFIGADSGMMHLASSVKIPVVGLFSEMDTFKYEPYGNQSVAIDTRIQSVDAVFSAISEILNPNEK